MLERPAPAGGLRPCGVGGGSGCLSFQEPGFLAAGFLSFPGEVWEFVRTSNGILSIGDFGRPELCRPGVRGFLFYVGRERCRGSPSGRRSRRGTAEWSPENGRPQGRRWGGRDWQTGRRRQRRREDAGRFRLSARIRDTAAATGRRDGRRSASVGFSSNRKDRRRGAAELSSESGVAEAAGASPGSVRSCGEERPDGIRLEFARFFF